MCQTPQHRILKNKQTNKRRTQTSSNIHKMERSQRPPRGRGRRRSRRCPALARCPCGAPSPPQKPDPAPSESHVYPCDPGRSDPWLGRGYWRVCRGTTGQPKSRRMNYLRVSACSKSTFSSDMSPARAAAARTVYFLSCQSYVLAEFFQTLVMSKMCHWNCHRTTRVAAGQAIGKPWARV